MQRHLAPPDWKNDQQADPFSLIFVYPRPAGKVHTPYPVIHLVSEFLACSLPRILSSYAFFLASGLQGYTFSFRGSSLKEYTFPFANGVHLGSHNYKALAFPTGTELG